MPANLTPEYLAADARYRAARTNEEKLDALEEMLRTIPKHKGTTRMQGEIKHKISALKKDSTKKKGPARKAYEFHVPKEGAGQVTILGPPNSGKSSLLDVWTNAEPEIADYPYTTRRPIVGMYKYQNIQIQMVDLPPVDREFFESWSIGIVRNCDLVLLFLDLASDGALDDFDAVFGKMQESKIMLQPAVTEKLLEDGTACKKTLVAGNKIDLPQAQANLELVREYLAGKFEILPVSVKDRKDLAVLGQRIFKGLDIIRAITKAPGKPPQTDDPVILRLGSTVEDFARSVHKDFAEKLKYARIWGEGAFEGQMVNRDYVLHDGDIVELHI